MKRASAISLLTIMLINGTGFYVYYAVQLWHIHESMKEALKELPENELLAFKLNQQAYDYYKVDDHELKIDGRMYDIARTVVQDDSVLVYCIRDEKEESLIAFVEEVITKPIKSNDSLFQSIGQMIAVTYLCPAVDIHLNIPEIEKSEESVYQFSLKTSWLELETPPPLV